MCPSSIDQDIKNGIDTKELQRQNLWLGEGGTEDTSVGRRDETGQGIGYIRENSLKGARDRRKWDQFDLEDLFLKLYISKRHPISIRRKDEG